MVRKNRKLIVHQDKSIGNFFIRAKRVNENGKFVTMPIKDGKALPRNRTDAELGRWIRQVLENCE
jgi:hypothetical protein